MSIGPITIQDRVADFLQAKGRAEVHYSGSHKYRQFTRSTDSEGKPTYYFLGKMGAVRIGRCASKSRSVTEIVHKHMKEWEEEIAMK